VAARLILHDLPPDEIKVLFPDASDRPAFFAAEPSVRPCCGCFGCWVKTPGICVIDDRGQSFAALIARYDELTIVSKLAFGGFSPAVKAVLDRSIGYVSPFFRLVNGDMHHRMRYDHAFILRCVFYAPDMAARDQEIARKLTAANALNLGAKAHTVEFYPSVGAIPGGRL
jgi:multimeric flavodoxin WrbA